MSVKKVDIKPGKIYVGKLPDSGVGEDEIMEHFSQFGTVSQVIRLIDWRKDNTPKNFCFVTFERVAKELIEEGICNIGGHKIQIKKVPSHLPDQSTRGRRGGYGGGPWMNQGGGWGGQVPGSEFGCTEFGWLRIIFSVTPKKLEVALDICRQNQKGSPMYIFDFHNKR